MSTRGLELPCELPARHAPPRGGAGRRRLVADLGGSGARGDRAAAGRGGRRELGGAAGGGRGARAASRRARCCRRSRRRCATTTTPASRNAAMEIYVRLGPSAPGAAARAARATPTRRSGCFAAVMLGSMKEAAAVRALVERSGRPRRERAPRRRDQPRADRLAARRSRGWSRRCAASRGCSTRPSTRSGRSATRGQPPRSSSCSTTSCCAPPRSRRWASVAGREALARIAPHLLDPDPALRNVAIRAVVEIEQRATASGESLDPEVQAALRREDLVDAPGRHARRRRPPQPPHRRGHARLAPRGAGPPPRCSSSWATRRCASSRATPSSRSASRSAPAWERRPRPRRRRGAARGACAAWPGSPPRRARRWWRPLIHDPATEVRAEAAAAIGRLGDEDAPMLLFELLGDESELIQESAMDALSRMGPERVPPAAGAGPRRRRRRRRGCAPPRPSACCATRPRRPRSWPRRATSARRVRAAALQALGELGGPEASRRPARGARRRELGRPPAGGSRPRASARARVGAAPAAAPRRGRPSAALRRGAGPRADPQPGGGASTCCRSSPSRARSCASPRSRPWGRSGPRRRCGRWSRSSTTPIATCGAPPRRASARSATPRRRPLSWWRSRTSTGACAAPPPPRSAASGAPRRSRRSLARVDDPDATVRRAAVRRSARSGDPRAAGRLAGRPRRPGAASGRARGPAPARRRGAAGDGARLRRRDARRRTSGGCSSTWPAASRTPPRDGCSSSALADPSPAVRVEAAIALGRRRLPRGAAAAPRPQGERPARRRSGRPPPSALRKLQPR